MQNEENQREQDQSSCQPNFGCIYERLKENYKNTIVQTPEIEKHDFIPLIYVVMLVNNETNIGNPTVIEIRWFFDKGLAQTYVDERNRIESGLKEINLSWKIFPIKQGGVTSL